jgi:SAM-dependent methyltransferase
LEWLTARTYGLDLSVGMLNKAQARNGAFRLIRGRASRLPFPERAFDLLFSVNALHHFDDPYRFVCEARRLLRPGGGLAVVGLDPHSGRDRWYLYDYFPGTLEADLDRYPSGGTIVDWMMAAGFDRVERRMVARIDDTRVGRQALEGPFLEKLSTSQLALLTDEAYESGMARIRAAIERAAAAGENVVFPVDISLILVVGHVGNLTRE